MAQLGFGRMTASKRAPSLHRPRPTTASLGFHFYISWRYIARRRRWASPLGRFGLPFGDDKLPRPSTSRSGLARRRLGWRYNIFASARSAPPSKAHNTAAGSTPIRRHFSPARRIDDGRTPAMPDFAKAAAAFNVLLPPTSLWAALAGDAEQPIWARPPYR